MYTHNSLMYLKVILSVERNQVEKDCIPLTQNSSKFRLSCSDKKQIGGIMEEGREGLQWGKGTFGSWAVGSPPSPWGGFISAFLRQHISDCVLANRRSLLYAIVTQLSCFKNYLVRTLCLSVTFKTPGGPRASLTPTPNTGDIRGWCPPSPGLDP